jgi:small subunit ribosomal protein S4
VPKIGDPKKLRKKYKTPNHPWNRKNIDDNKLLSAEFGLRNRREILIADSFLKKYMDIAKKLIANTTEQGEREKAQILTKLTDLGLISAGAELNEILGLDVRDVLNRRLQSIVHRQGLARSVAQARQFIVHRHIRLGDKEMTIPGYLVSLAEESSVSFKENSALADEEHPERANEKEAVAEEVAKVTGKKAKVTEVAKEPTIEKKSTEEKNEKGNE